MKIRAGKIKLDRTATISCRGPAASPAAGFLYTPSVERMGRHRVLQLGHPARLVFGAAIPPHAHELVAGEAAGDGVRLDRN